MTMMFQDKKEYKSKNEIIIFSLKKKEFFYLYIYIYIYIYIYNVVFTLI